MKVRIGSTKYDVVKAVEASDEGLVDCCGYVKSHLAKIVLNNDYPSQTKIQTFWHEFVHSALIEIGLDALGSDEGFVDAFARQIYAFVDNNDIEKLYAFLE